MPSQLDPRMIDPSKTAVTFTATTVVTPSGTSDLWNATSSFVQSNSAANTLTTSVCTMSGNGTTPFTMQFTKGLLTSITF